MKRLLTFLSAVFISSSLNAQIPNAGFETWTTVGAYEVPTGWDNLDSLTNSLSVYTCEKGTPGSPGASYLRLTSKTFGIIVAPGVAVSGKLDMTTYTPKSGFAYASRPGSLTGTWQHMIFGTSQGSVTVLLSKWNTGTNRRDTVAFVSRTLTGMDMSWTPFSIPLAYYSPLTPDSAIILLAASGLTPTNNDYLYVDNLAFVGTVPAAITNVANVASAFSVAPNPACGTAKISYSSASEKSVEILVNDLSGRTVLSLSPKALAGDNQFTINVSDLSKGIYIIRVVDGQNSQVQKLVVE